MPCYDDRNTYSYGHESAMKEAVHNSVPAELLCELLTQNPRLASSSKKLEDWWVAHQERDRQKKEKEKVERDRALRAARKAVLEAQSRLNLLLKRK